VLPAILLFMASGLRASDGARAPTWSQHAAAAEELKRAGNLAGAQAEWSSALAAARAAGDSAAVALVLDRMGSFDNDLGRFVEAASHFEESLGIWRSRLGRDHIALIRVINRLAALYLETGQPGKAERLELAQWRERLEAADPASDDLVPLLGYMGTLDSMRGRFPEALGRFREALHLIERRGRLGSAEHAATLNNLGLACLRARQYDPAIRHLYASVALWEKLRGVNSLNAGLTACNLAQAYLGAGRTDQAESEMRRALGILEPVLGPDSLRTAAVLRAYGELLRKLHRKAEAKEIAARADRIVREQAHQVPGRYQVDAAELSFRPR
jgi:tetratricopeptide (TPR) repeat protein